jgi:hypothetical protein
MSRIVIITLIYHRHKPIDLKHCMVSLTFIDIFLIRKWMRLFNQNSFLLRGVLAWQAHRMAERYLGRTTVLQLLRATFWNAAHRPSLLMHRSLNYGGGFRSTVALGFTVLPLASRRHGHCFALHTTVMEAENSTAIRTLVSSPATQGEIQD